MVAYWKKFTTHSGQYYTRMAVSAVHYVLPVLLTLACYVSTIVVVSVASPLF